VKPSTVPSLTVLVTLATLSLFIIGVSPNSSGTSSTRYWAVRHGCDSPMPQDLPTSASAQEELYAAERRALLEAVESAETSFASIKDRHGCGEDWFSGVTTAFELVCKSCGTYQITTQSVTLSQTPAPSNPSGPPPPPSTPSPPVPYNSLEFQEPAPSLSLAAAIPWMKRNIVASLPSGFRAGNWIDPWGVVTRNTGVDPQHGDATLTYLGPGPIGLSIRYSEGTINVFVARSDAIAYHGWGKSLSPYQSAPQAPAVSGSTLAPGQQALQCVGTDAIAFTIIIDSNASKVIEVSGPGNRTTWDAAVSADRVSWTAVGVELFDAVESNNVLDRTTGYLRETIGTDVSGYQCTPSSS
jgi:hypothetical protein